MSGAVRGAGEALESRPANLRDSVRAHPVLWLAGAAAAGFAATMVVKRLGVAAAATSATALLARLARLSALTRTTGRFTSWATGGREHVHLAQDE
ncbi:MAG: hypothetical protein WD226_02875 [Planctomycetota bacterium]